MKNERRIFLLSSATLALTVAFGLSLSTARGEEPETFKILTYNTHNAVGLDKKLDYARIGEIAKASGAEVVALQELDYKTKRSKGVDALGEIAKAAEMKGTYGAAIQYQGGLYGIGVLTKEQPIRVEVVPLPGREEERALLFVELRKYIFLCSHWSLTQEDRDASVKIVTEKMKQQEKPVFVCGDFNAQPDENSIKELEKDWTILTDDAFTFPADEPSVRIDYICAADPRGKITADEWKAAVVSSTVLDEKVASDHRPVLVEIKRSVFK